MRIELVNGRFHVDIGDNVEHVLSREDVLRLVAWVVELLSSREVSAVDIPREVLDLRKDRRGRPRCKSCVLCGVRGYAAPLIEDQKVPLCRRHYNTWYRRRKRAVERALLAD